MGTRNTEHPVAETLHQGFELHRNERVILDDENVGCDLGRKLATGFFDQSAQLHDVDIEHARCIRLGEAFERHQQKCLAGEGRDIGELLLSRQPALPWGGGAVDRHRIPNFCE